MAMSLASAAVALSVRTSFWRPGQFQFMLSAVARSHSRAEAGFVMLVLRGAAS
jgi:hypothetical protein